MICTELKKKYSAAIIQREYEVAQLVEALHGGRPASIPDGVIRFLLT